MDAFDLASSVRYMDDAKLKTRSLDPSLINNFEAGLALNSLNMSVILIMLPVFLSITKKSTINKW